MTIRSGAAALVLLATFGVSTSLAQPAADTPDSLVLAAKRAAGTDLPGTFARICIDPDNANAGATILMSNRTEFDGAYDKVRLAQLSRAAGDPHPYELDAAAIQRYFTLTADCAEAQRLSTTIAKP